MNIVILPGLDGTGLLLRAFAKALEASHKPHVISYPVDMSSYVELGAWLKAQLPAEDHVIVAESFSGPLAVDLAASPSPALKGVVFVATFARAPRRLPLPLLRLTGYLPENGRFLARVSEAFVIGRSGTPAFRAQYRIALQRVPCKTLSKRLEEVMQVDRRAKLTRIDLPCTYVRASGDLLVPFSASKDFACCCKEIRAVKGPHFLLQAAPEACAGLVTDFIAGLPDT